MADNTIDRPGERTCRECGCTDSLACVGGCWWVQPDLCSAFHVVFVDDGLGEEAEDELTAWEASPNRD